MRDTIETKRLPKRIVVQTGLLLAMIIFFTAGPWLCSSAAAQDQTPTILITGANRNIGLSFVEGYIERGWNVIATCRNPSEADDLQALASRHSNLVIEELDVTDFEEIEALAKKYRDTPIDVLLNNAGINPYRSQSPAIFGSMDYDRFEEILKVNVIGPLKVSESFLDHVAASEQKKVVVMTSTGGSIAYSVETARTSAPDYRASKAAINMIMRLLSLEVAERHIIIGIIGPNRFDDAAINSMISIIDGLTPETSGVFYNAAGEVMPW